MTVESLPDYESVQFNHLVNKKGSKVIAAEIFLTPVTVIFSLWSYRVFGQGDSLKKLKKSIPAKHVVFRC